MRDGKCRRIQMMAVADQRNEAKAWWMTEEGGYDGDGHIDGSETRLAELGEGGCSLGNCVGVGAGTSSTVPVADVVGIARSCSCSVEPSSPSNASSESIISPIGESQMAYLRRHTTY